MFLVTSYSLEANVRLFGPFSKKKLFLFGTNFLFRKKKMKKTAVMVLGNSFESL